MLHTDVIYVVYREHSDQSDYGWSPDGEGMYWRDSLREAYYDAGFESIKTMNFTAREFDNHRYGHMPEDWGIMSHYQTDPTPYEGAWEDGLLSGSGENMYDTSYTNYLNG